MSHEIDIRLAWYGQTVTAELEREMSQRVRVAAELLRSQTVRNLRAKQTRTVGPSAPGEVPHVDTGLLSNSIFTKMIDSLQAIVGTALKYGLWLHEGTSRMGERPFFTITINQVQDQIRAVLTRRIN